MDNNNEFKQMDLDFTKKPKPSVKKSVPIKEEEPTIQKSEGKFPTNLINTKENKNGDKIKKIKANKEIRSSLTKTIFWSSILLLSLLFGGDAITAFANKVGDFIKNVDDNESAKAIGDFFLAFARIWEALLFAFFIVFSVGKILLNIKPWLNYRNENKKNKDKE